MDRTQDMFILLYFFEVRQDDDRFEFNTWAVNRCFPPPWWALKLQTVKVAGMKQKKTWVTDCSDEEEFHLEMSKLEKNVNDDNYSLFERM